MKSPIRYLQDIMCQMVVKKNKIKTNKQKRNLTSFVPFLNSAALQFGPAADLKGAGLNSSTNYHLGVITLSSPLFSIFFKVFIYSWINLHFQFKIVSTLISQGQIHLFHLTNVWLSEMKHINEWHLQNSVKYTSLNDALLQQEHLNNIFTHWKQASFEKKEHDQSDAGLRGKCFCWTISTIGTIRTFVCTVTSCRPLAWDEMSYLQQLRGLHHPALPSISSRTCQG